VREENNDAQMNEYFFDKYFLNVKMSNDLNLSELLNIRKDTIITTIKKVEDGK
jgi:hypothetical protein